MAAQPGITLTCFRPSRDLADDVAALIRHYDGAQADVLGFSYGGGIAMRLVGQYPGMARRLILASTTAYRDYGQLREASADHQARAQLCPEIAWDDPVLTGPGAPDGAPSRAMAYAGAPREIWHLDRLDDWHRILAGVRFSSDWNGPYAVGQLRPGTPDYAESVLRTWARPVLILHGSREMEFPVSLGTQVIGRLAGGQVPVSDLRIPVHERGDGGVRLGLAFRVGLL